MNITILGCGAYGLALAKSFLENETKVLMWSKFQEEVDSLKGIYTKMRFTTDLQDAIQDSDLLVFAIPIAFLEETLKDLRSYYDGQDILIASKGIDRKRKKFAYEIVQEYLEDATIGVISGGTFAADMGKQKVMGLTLGTKSENLVRKVRKSLHSRYLRVQINEDVIGVSVCGAIKNVMAIGFGLLDGANYPESSRFLFLTEAIYEIRSFIQTLGGNTGTIMSYAGLDDIMMTCTSSKSRNYTLGKMIGSGISIEEIEEYKRKTTIEGLGTSQAIYLFCKEKNINLPICTLIYEILYEKKDKMALVHYLEEKES